MSDALVPKATSKAATGPDVSLSSDPSKDRTVNSKWDHGETPQWVTDAEKAQKDAAKDPGARHRRSSATRLLSLSALHGG
jgi:hypothetical protein